MRVLVENTHSTTLTRPPEPTRLFEVVIANNVESTNRVSASMCVLTLKLSTAPIFVECWFSMTLLKGHSAP
jgi:hypothetical protein